MTLTRALARYTSSTTRARGAAYFESGAVVYFDPQQSLVYAIVRGTDNYVVRMELTGHALRATCTCPYFDDNLVPCKHLWAVALTCEGRGFLEVPEPPAGKDNTVFIPVPVGDDETRADTTVRGRSFEDAESQLSSPTSTATTRTQPARISPWQSALAAITATAAQAASGAATPPGQLLYCIDLGASKQSAALVVHVLRQEQKQNGDWGVPRTARLTTADITDLPDPDRAIVERLAGPRPAHTWWSGANVDVPSPVHLRGAVAGDLLPAICATGRCRLALSEVATIRPQDSPLVPLQWVAGDPFACRLLISRDDAAGAYKLEGALESGDRTVPLRAIRLLLDEGLALTEGSAMRIDPAGVMPWMRQLHERGELRVPFGEAERLREALVQSGAADIDGLPQELQATVIDAVPIPHLVVSSQRHKARQLTATLAFSYECGPVLTRMPPLVPTRTPQVLARRDHDAERHAVERLTALGVRRSWDAWERRQRLVVTATDLPRLVRTLVLEGWRVEAEGRRYRLASAAPVLDVRSGVDWFEVRGEAMFGEQQVSLPALLAAIKHNNRAIPLDDGTYGIVPDEWLRQFGPLVIGRTTDDHVRFKPSQMPLLDALLAAKPSVSWDATAASARDRLRAFGRIEPIDPPASFTGTLREYQREGLGWLAFLREFHFGGCLADDMGLGKTVMVLALLDERRQSHARGRSAARPSLVVVPRSVLFNWQQEAARFAPRLKVLDFSGARRTERLHLIAEHDVILTTYGTLRRDAAALVGQKFDYVILDEAQTVKNAQTAAAKAARLLDAEHRLALSGTPVENRLADLWSLFEFLNPGLLSGSTSFAQTFSADTDGAELQLLARGLRPFILRRTKEQVASELPSKTEQTIICELERPQRLLYNELRDHYRRQLLDVKTTWPRSKLQVLEALLRLRQAACHPGLVDPGRAGEASAKLDLLVPRLIETLEEGHKALVFSQFTSFLALLRTRLDASGVEYEYLDGRTRDRQARVSRFQADPACRLFLISLKAGGLGLNLTAADYVFILDPWWNPAVEAQAVDRSHRIGQTRKVFAYRLVSRDTVEERVLELQQRKRELADAVITADNSVLQTLQREDLELLLS